MTRYARSLRKESPLLFSVGVSMAVRFIDAKIILRALTQSEPAQAAASQALLLRVEAGKEKVTTSPLVLFEVIFTLQSPRSYKLVGAENSVTSCGLHVFVYEAAEAVS